MLTDAEIQNLKQTVNSPGWQAFKKLADDIKEREDKISNLPRFNTATALEKHLEIKRKAVQLFDSLIAEASMQEQIKIETNDPERPNFFKEV